MVGEFLHSSLEEGENVAVGVVQYREPSDLGNFLFRHCYLGAKCFGLAERLVYVLGGEVVEEPFGWRVSFEQSSQGIVWACCLFVADEPVVHVSSFILVELPAEELAVEAGDFSRVAGWYFEVYESVFAWYGPGCGC